MLPLLLRLVPHVPMFLLLAARSRLDRIGKCSTRLRTGWTIEKELRARLGDAAR